MTLQSSGAISISQIKSELGNSSGSLRTLSAAAGKSSPDAMSEFYGYSNVVAPPSGVHKITFTATWSAGNYMILAYGPQYNYSNSLTIHGGTNPSSAPYTRYLTSMRIYGTNTGSSVTNVTRVEIYSNGSNVNNPQYTLFDEMNSASSKIKLTDSSNNQIWEANFSGGEVSPLPSFPTNPANSDPYGFNRRPTGKFYMDYGECGASNEYRWSNYISTHSYTGYRHMFDLVLGQQYKFFFES